MVEANEGHTRRHLTMDKDRITALIFFVNMDLTIALKPRSDDNFSGIQKSGGCNKKTEDDA